MIKHDLGVNLFEYSSGLLKLKEANPYSMSFSKMDESAINCDIRDIYPVTKKEEVIQPHLLAALEGIASQNKMEYNGEIVNVRYLPVGKKLCVVEFHPITKLMHFLDVLSVLMRGCPIQAQRMFKLIMERV